MITDNEMVPLDLNEVFWISGLILLFLLELLRAKNSRDPLAWFTPPMVMMGILAYYCLIGPLSTVFRGLTLDRGVDLRDAMVFAWAGAFIFFSSLIIGFRHIPQWIPRRRFNPGFDPKAAWKLGIRLNVWAIALFGLGTGPKLFALLNPFTARESVIGASGGIDLGAFTNYATLALNLLIPGTLLLWASWLNQPRRGAILLGWLLAGLGLFTSLGFRYRLVLLLAPMALLWYLVRQRRPNLWIVSGLAVFLILLAGLVGITRSYWRGLDLDQLQDKSVEQVWVAGLHDSVVFLTTGGIIRDSPDVYPFVGAEPFVQTLLFPLPRAIYTAKDSDRYRLEALKSLYGSDLYAVGAFFLNYAEYYLIAGWPSVIGMGVILGWLLRALWNWFTIRRREPLAQVTYAVAVCYLYMVVSRGYLPQVVMLFCFTVLPLFVLYRRGSQLLLPPSSPGVASPLLRAGSRAS